MGEVKTSRVTSPASPEDDSGTGLQYHPPMTDEIPASATSVPATAVSSPAPPIHKVGVVVLRRDADEFRVLLLRPRAKREGGATPYVLPRGTRQYQDPETGEWLDARTAAEAAAHADKKWESFERAARREVHEEAGVPPSLLQQRMKEMGARDYHAPKGAVYPVYWFCLELKCEDMAKLSVPVDAEEVKWFTLKEMEEAAAREEARPGYVSVVKEAMENLKSEIRSQKSEIRGQGSGVRGR